MAHPVCHAYDSPELQARDSKEKTHSAEGAGASKEKTHSAEGAGRRLGKRRVSRAGPLPPSYGKDTVSSLHWRREAVIRGEDIHILSSGRDERPFRSRALEGDGEDGV